MKAQHIPLVAACLIVAVILLGLIVSAGWTVAADLRISNALSLRVGQSDPGLIAFMQGVSWIGGGTPRWIIVILLSALVWHWCGRRCAVALAGASLLANLASNALKFAFDRARPDIIAHLDHVNSASYPSGHATSAAVVYLLLAWLAPPRWRPFAWTLATAMILLNAASRIMLGVHWASDIAGGTMLGGAFALLGAWWVLWPERSSGPKIPLS
ncbi:phosphatase PAP2 family protein [Sphingopyxis sp.]|uniref:phosphatase PAP2 family protein n=1 Tax=Sphingopyxis sp. TaxID=1908224 RepID=UPI00263409A9|nr:phosphatase PAP2 family protein [Sphingopyxis sp.]MCW0198711.1 phosphatase PAP2 family protein [Sphingopyxis sp.]